MARYTITYACGCTIEKHLYGKLSERDAYIEWAKDNECPECKKARLNAASQIKAQENNLPTLTGSEKQTAWATTIRQTFLDDLEKLIAERMKLVNDSNREKAMQSLAQINETRDKMVSSETTSDFWINHRNWSVPDMISTYIELHL